MTRVPSATASGAPDVFPVLYCCTQLTTSQSKKSPKKGKPLTPVGERLYDVKFYPFPTASGEQIFAVAGVKDIFICRLSPQLSPPYEIIRWFKDTTQSSEWNSITWTCSPSTGKPWICVAGAVPKQVQIFDVESNQHVRSLVGHGRGINDLHVSPIAKNLLFSAGEDYTIRIWNLDPEYEKQPCVGLFAGEGHRQSILTLDLHPNGRWMLSGGLDTAVCLWSIPSPEELARDNTQSYKEHHPEPKLIYYPYFHSTEVHHNFVDSIKFHGDLVISKAAKDPGQPDAKMNEILIWKIQGFDPDDEAPAEPPIPSAGAYTRSAFFDSGKIRGFQRLLTLDLPLTDRFYQRFGLLDLPGMRPILAMGNQESKMLMWDLQKFEEGLDPGEARDRGKKARTHKIVKKARVAGKGVARPVNSNSDDFNRLDGLRREQSINSDTASATPGHDTPQPSSTSHSAPQERKYELSDAFERIPAHSIRSLNTRLSKQNHFGTSAIAFSPDGTWMIGVGDNGMINIFHRDASVV